MSTMEIPATVINNFRLPEVPITEELVARVWQTFHLDITSLSPDEQIVIANYVHHGAAAAIMDLVARRRSE